MSDYLGPNQTRVLDSTNHSFESITYQKQKPPLSSEVNLGGKIDAERTQQIVQTFVPSGWSVVGQIRDDVLPSACQTGDVLCSSDCSSNSILFVAQNYGQNTEKNIAMVNGWRVVVQGSNSPTGNGYAPYTGTTENNSIRLLTPPESGCRVDFVFLEVWRKLLTPEDTVYQYGNVDYHGVPFTNDLIDPARGFETSRRIQLQYRIRVSEIDDIDLYPEGFCPSVYVQGPLPTPITTCSNANFSQIPGDPGLWIAGAGDSVAQEILETVDGHTYAIPMFAIRRRNTQAFDPRVGHINGAQYSLADYKNGIASDRPDNLYNDWIVADDFIDLRHLVGSKKDINIFCSQAFRALQNNILKTRMGYILTGGEQNGSVIMKVDSITDTSSVSSWSTIINSGDGLRRWFANAAVDIADSPDGTAYTSSAIGLSQVPTIFLEARKIDSYPNTMYPIAMRDQDVRVRYGTAAAPVDSSDLGRQYNMLRARGGNYHSLYNFGHQMVYHVLGNGTNTITINRTIDGYDILGIAGVTANSITQTVITVTRTATVYTVTLGSVITVGNDIEVVLYTGSKYFDANKQSRGIIDCYQMVEIQTDQTPNGSLTAFTFDAGATHNIMAIGSRVDRDGTGFVYIETGLNGTLQNITGNNRDTSLPDGTSMTINFSSPPSGTAVKVPVLIRTAIQPGEGYSFFYNYVPYQGLWDHTGSVVSGAVETLGPAITTTAGSGNISNFSFVTEGTFDGSEFISGSGTSWLSTVRPGYLVKYQQYTNIKTFFVKTIISDTLIELESAVGESASNWPFTIEAPDLPMYGYPNIIDRFPALHAYNDHSGNGELLSFDSTTINPTLETRILNRAQDIMDVPAGNVQIGRDDDAERGRNMVYLSSGQYGTGALGLRYETVKFDAALIDHYKKTYQSYVFNDEGKLYLMVVGSETDNIIPGASTDGTCWFNPFSTNDVVDLFEIPGRPLITG
jgi:hypothetical protein